jgi:hypothetical protein
MYKTRLLTNNLVEKIRNVPRYERIAQNEKRRRQGMREKNRKHPSVEKQSRNKEVLLMILQKMTTKLPSRLRLVILQPQEDVKWMGSRLSLRGNTVMKQILERFGVYA